MLTALLLSCLVSPARASQAPAYDPEPSIKVLLERSQAGTQDVDKLLGTTLEKEQAPILKAAVDDLQAQTQGVSDAAHRLDSDAGQPDQHMTDRVKGRGEKSFDDAYDDAASVDAALRKRWQDDTAQAKRLKDAPASGKLSADELSKRKDDVDRLIESLSEVDGVLSALEDALRTMDDARGTAKQAKDLGGEGKYELGSAAGEAVKAAQAVAQASTEAKARIDLLGVEPQTENHTMASVKLQPVLDGGRAASRQADVVKNRARDFASRYAQFTKAESRFDDARKTMKDKRDEASAELASAEDSLGRLKGQ